MAAEKAAADFNNKNEAPRKPLGLYLHVPFCIRKCNYCDFLSFGSVSEEEQRAYFDSLRQEIKINSEIYGNKYYVDSIFIGGGTPSMVEARLITEMLDAVRDGFAIDADAEITIESNPRTLAKNKIEAYLAAGVNRLSIGAQSLDDNLLGYLGRVHNRDDFLENYFLARECGFNNINIDLMFAIPGQTLESWMNTLKQAIRLEPEHISFYSLQLEEGTPFFSMLQQGNLKETDDVLDRTMYHEAVKELKKNGYEHYEISNAAKAGYQCRHNLKYWSMKDYLALGLGSHSFLDGERFSNEADLSRYLQIGMQNIGCGCKEESESPFVVWRHKNTNTENISEYLFTGLRKLEGIDLSDFERRFEWPLEEVYSSGWHRLQKYIDEGYLIRSNRNLRFTLEGIDISNSILVEFV